MQNIRYHIVNIGACTLFAFLFALTANQIIRFNMAPELTAKSSSRTLQRVEEKRAMSLTDYNILYESNFFKIPMLVSTNPSQPNAVQSTDLNTLKLLGTIVGPDSISQALIRSQTAKQAEVFKIYTNVYGYKLVRIDNDKVYLKANDQVYKLYLFGQPKDETTPAKTNTVAQNSSNKFTKNLSLAEFQQTIAGDMDQLLNGVRAGPYRVDNKIEGFKLFKIPDDSPLFRLGARSGDIIKRINNHPVDSTEKMYKLWQNLTAEKHVTIDLLRGDQVVTYEFNITN